MGSLRRDAKDYLEPPAKWHRGRRTLAGVPKRLDYLTEREYLDALVRDLKRRLDVEKARTEHERAKGRLYLSKAVYYAGKLDQLTGRPENTGAQAELDAWLDDREAKAARPRQKGD